MKGGENEMQSFPHDRLWLITALREEDIRRANDARRSGRPASSIRRAIGTSIVRVGARLAGEPTYELARSR
jgi:hypothetical protein